VENVNGDNTVNQRSQRYSENQVRMRIDEERPRFTRSGFDVLSMCFVRRDGITCTSISCPTILGDGLLRLINDTDIFDVFE